RPADVRPPAALSHRAVLEAVRLDAPAEPGPLAQGGGEVKYVFASFMWLAHITLAGRNNTHPASGGVTCIAAKFPGQSWGIKTKCKRSCVGRRRRTDWLIRSPPRRSTAATVARLGRASWRSGGG